MCRVNIRVDSLYPPLVPRRAEVWPLSCWQVWLFYLKIAQEGDFEGLSDSPLVCHNSLWIKYWGCLLFCCELFCNGLFPFVWRKAAGHSNDPCLMLCKQFHLPSCWKYWRDFNQEPSFVKLFLLVLCVAKLSKWVPRSATVPDEDVQVPVMAKQKLSSIVIGCRLCNLKNGPKPQSTWEPQLKDIP